MKKVKQGMGWIESGNAFSEKVTFKLNPGWCKSLVCKEVGKDEILRDLTKGHRIELGQGINMIYILPLNNLATVWSKNGTVKAS